MNQLFRSVSETGYVLSEAIQQYKLLSYLEKSSYFKQKGAPVSVPRDFLQNLIRNSEVASVYGV